MNKSVRTHTTTTYVCGVCKKEGHNKRTCKSGKNVHPNVSISEQRTSPRPSKDTTITKSNLIGRWDDYIQKVTTEPVHKNGAESEDNSVDTQVADGGYSLGELETYWILKNGEDGKRKIVHYQGQYSGYSYRAPAEWGDKETEELFKFVNEVYKEAPSTQTAVWAKFFKNFGAEAKHALLRRYKYPTGYAREKGSPLNSTPLPLPFFAVFAKDPSKAVREVLAKAHGLPFPVAKILAEDKNYDVRVELALNTSRNIGPVLDQLYSQARGRDGSEVQNFWQRQGRIYALKRNLARNPQTPTKVLHDIFLRTDNDLGIKMSIYSNPNAPTEALRARWKKAYAQLNPVPKNIEQELAMHYTGRNGIYYSGLLTEVGSLAAGGHIEDSEVRKFLDAEMNKFEYQRKNNITPGLFLDSNFLRTFNKTHLTREKLEKYYTSVGGADSTSLQILTAILQQGEVSPRIVQECSQRTPPSNKSYHYEQFVDALEKAQKRQN